jgi:RNA polymerase sigma-70 factor (ECF subfamily)
LANPSELIRRVYAYVAYRIGPGPDAEDVTSEVFERALRYRESYDRSRGEPLSWLLGIARRCVDDAVRRARMEKPKASDPVPPQDLEAEAIQRLTVAAAIARLDERAQDLLALRYGADLTARQIGELLDLRTNAVEVALHRALSRLRPELEEPPMSKVPSVEEARLLPPVEPSPSASQK